MKLHSLALIYLLVCLFLAIINAAKAVVAFLEGDWASFSTHVAVAVAAGGCVWYFWRQHKKYRKLNQ